MRAGGLRVRLPHGRLSSTAIFFLVVDAFEHAERRFIRRIVRLLGIERRIFWRLLQQQFEQLAKLGWLVRFIGWIFRWLFFFLQRRQSGFFRRPEWRFVRWQLGWVAGWR